MNLKAKKVNSDGLVRLETSGKIMEVIIQEDLSKPENAKVLLCFRGKSSSGIVELNRKELDFIIKNIKPQTELIKEAKILKFSK